MSSVDILLTLIPLALILAVLIPPILALIDLAKRRFPNDLEKVLWVLIILFFNPIGAIIYYFMVAKKA